MADFSLHPQLAADTAEVCNLKLCKALLMNDSTYPWLILVPMQPTLKEVHDLSAHDQHVLMDEIAYVSKVMQGHFKADKMNVAALGNMVPQLHIHIIARFDSDPAWPGPVWGKVPTTPYPTDTTAAMVAQLKALLL